MRARGLFAALAMGARLPAVLRLLFLAAVALLAAAGAWAAAGPVPRVRLSVGGAAVTALAFLPAGRSLAVADAHGVVAIWRLQPRDLVASLMGAGSWVAFVPGGAESKPGEWSGEGADRLPRLLTLDRRGRLGVWSADDPQPRFWRNEVGTVAAMSADGGWLAASRGGADLRLLDLRHPSERMRILPAPREAADAHTTALALSPHGERAAQAVGGSVWIRGCGEDGGGRVAGRLPVSGPVQALAWSPDGRWLAAAGGALRIWDVERRRKAATILGASSAAVFTPDGRLVGGDDRGCLHVVNPATGAEQATLRCGGGAVTALACSPDGVLLAAGTATGRVTVWDLRNVNRGQSTE